MKYIQKFRLFESNKDGQYVGIKANSKVYPHLLYHGTTKELDEFYLDDNLDYEEIDGNGVWDIDMPSGYLFLTNDINEARAYGHHVIPFEITEGQILTIEVDGNAPSRTFDDDYNYGTEYELWQKFTNGDEIYSCLEVKSYNKSTFICAINAITPRMDLAKEYYS